MAEPVQIKIYGILPMTRRTYVRLWVLGIFLVLGLVGLLALGLPPLIDTLGPDQAAVPMLKWIHGNLLWITLVILAAEVVEAVMVLRQFHRAETRGRNPRQR